MEGRPGLEAELVEQARQGDAAAFESLVRVHQEVAVRTAWVVSGGADVLEGLPRLCGVVVEDVRAGARLYVN